MQLSPETSQAIQAEVKRFAADLNLSDDQKNRLKTALESARQRIDQLRATGPDIGKEAIMAKVKEARPAIRERVAAFLTPDQLTKWDAEVAKAKSFLGYTA